MPRPDIARLGIRYRRIPILSIGRDVYLDTRLIIQKLEPLSSDRPKLGATSAEHQAIERLLETYAVDGGLFTSAAKLIPPDIPLIRDPKFQRDRADFFGASSGTSSRKSSSSRSERPPIAVRPEAVLELRRNAELLENTLLADGRDWILGNAEPSLADIEAVWPLHWLAGMSAGLTPTPALPPDQVSAKQFPRVFAWIARFQAAVTAAKKHLPHGEPKSVSGEQAANDIVLQAPLYEDAEAVGVDEKDPVASFHGLRKGHLVSVWPIDSGSSPVHRDIGQLVALNEAEVIIETEVGVRLHAPRHGFRVSPAATGNGEGGGGSHGKMSSSL